MNFHVWHYYEYLNLNKSGLKTEQKNRTLYIQCLVVFFTMVCIFVFIFRVFFVSFINFLSSWCTWTVKWTIIYFYLFIVMIQSCRQPNLNFKSMKLNLEYTCINLIINYVVTPRAIKSYIGLTYLISSRLLLPFAYPYSYCYTTIDVYNHLFSIVLY